MAAAEAGIRGAVSLYTQGTTKLGAGDASGQADVDAATATLQQTCGPLGFASNEECVANYGLTLPPLPAAPPGQPADPLAAAEAGIRAAADLYTRGATKLGAGDASGQADVDTATATLQQTCSPLGFASNEECVANYGLTLPPLPAAPTQEELVAQINAAYASYTDAIAQANAGNYAAGKAAADAAVAQITAACAGLGQKTIVDCIQQELPTFPGEPSAAGGTATAAGPATNALGALVQEYNRHIADFKQYGEANSDARLKLPFILQQIADTCAGLGTLDTDQCLAGQGYPPLELLPPLAAASSTPPTDAERTAQVDKAQRALADYFDAIAGVGTGYDAALEKATAARQALTDACGALGETNVNHCVGQELPEFPAPDGGANGGVGQDDTIARVAELRQLRDDYEAGNAALVALIKAGRQIDEDRASQNKLATAINVIASICNTIAGSEVINAASPLSALNDCLNTQGLAALSPSYQAALPKVPPKILANLKMMVDDYNAYTQSTAPFDKDRAIQAISDYCAGNGLGDLDTCLNIAGLALADQTVTPTTKEQLPDGTALANAAPLLDSAKGGDAGGQTRAPAGGATTTTTTTTVTTLTAGPAPKTDAEAQGNLPKVILPVTTQPGRTIDPKTVTFMPPKSQPSGKGADGQAGGAPVASFSLNASITPDGGFIFQLGGQVVISNPEQERGRLFDPKKKDRIGYEKLADDRVRETVTRSNGTRVVTIRGSSGEVDQRQVLRPGGRSFTLAAGATGGLGKHDAGRWRDPGDELPPLRLTIPARDYVLDADDADEGDLAFFLVQPPVERVQRIYTIDEVKHSARVRDSVRRLEIGALTFDTGKATVGDDQIRSLKKLADAMLELLDRDPAETFLIEGHTDAVGDELSNLALSDARANTIARILSEYFDIPPENLATQGYGETFLKVRTDAAERLNRRVTVRRITPLITVASAD